MSTKTPVSILQEMMAKQGNPPQYDLIYDGSGTHEALFKFKVYADNVVATGSGRSKKEAKHEAAKNALKTLAQYQITSSVEQSNLEEMEVISPYKDKVQDNAVGSLFDLCTMHEIPIPEYQHVREEGPPHERIFTCVCCISKLKETGVGRTKKQAKQIAAGNMLSRLKESLGDMMTGKDSPDSSTESTSQENFKEVINRYISKVGSPKRKVKLNDYPCLYHKTLLSTPDDVVSEVEKLILPEYRAALEKCVSFWQNLVNCLAEKMQLSATWFTSPKNSEGMLTVWVQLSTTPEFVCYATGQQEDDVQAKAALQLLDFLKIMMRKPKKEEAPQTAALPEKENL